MQINRVNNDGQNVVDYHFREGATGVQTLMVTVSAGERINKEQRKLVRQKNLEKRKVNVPEVLPSEDDLHSSLKEICREAIQNHLLDLNPHENLFIRVPLLGLSGPLTTSVMCCPLSLFAWVIKFFTMPICLRATSIPSFPPPISHRLFPCSRAVMTFNVQ